MGNFLGSYKLTEVKTSPLQILDHGESLFTETELQNETLDATFSITSGDASTFSSSYTVNRVDPTIGLLIGPNQTKLKMTFICSAEKELEISKSSLVNEDIQSGILIMIDNSDWVKEEVWTLETPDKIVCKKVVGDGYLAARVFLSGPAEVLTIYDMQEDGLTVLVRLFIDKELVSTYIYKKKNEE